MSNICKHIANEFMNEMAIGKEEYIYTNGCLTKCNFETPDSVAYTTWELLEENAMGKPTKTHTDKVYRETDYNLSGLPVRQVGYVRRPALPGEGMNPIIPPITPIVPTPEIGPDTAETDIQSSGIGEIITIDIPMQDMTCQWSMPGRRLMSRRDNSREIDTEFFGYDAMNRLISHDGKEVSYSTSVMHYVIP